MINSDELIGITEYVTDVVITGFECASATIIEEISGRPKTATKDWLLPEKLIGAQLVNKFEVSSPYS
jgi:hypothetical protein